MQALQEEPFKPQRSLDGQMLSAVAWNAAARWSTQLLSWASTIVVARLLTPSDYGLVGMAGIYLVLAGLISQIGIGDAIIALRDLEHRQIAALNTVAWGMGVVLLLLSALVAHPLAVFFSTPALVPVIFVSSATYLMNGLQVVPRALLQKDMRFKLLAGFDVVRALCQMIVTVALAWLGYRYWSLVYGYLAGAAGVLVLTLIWQRCSLAVPRLSELRRELRFSSNVLVSAVGWYAYSTADFLVAGRMLGQATLGSYSIAWTISTAPIEKIGDLITNVTPAFFSAMQHDKAALRRYLLGITEVLSYITVPASIGLALVADLLVPVLLGPKWMGAIGPLRILGLAMAFRSLAVLPGRILTAVGQTSFVMWTTIASAIVLPSAFFVACRWGANGIASVWILIYPLVMIPMFRKTFRQIELRPRDYLSCIKPSAVAAALMIVVTAAIHLVLPPSIAAYLRLIVLMLVVAVTYLGALYLFYWERVLRVVRTVRPAAPPPVPVASGN